MKLNGIETDLFLLEKEGVNMIRLTGNQFTLTSSRFKGSRFKCIYADINVHV